jgi:dephospho-CoA kinase
MARSRLEIASDFLEQVAHGRKLVTEAEQAFQLSDEEKIKLAEAIIDTDDQLTRLADELEQDDPDA